jgi:hypothetical protein
VAAARHDLAFVLVGALVAARQPRNCVGWLLLAVGLCLTVSFASQSYARYVLVTAPGSLPGGRYASFLFLLYFGAVAILACFLPLYFPTGRLLSPRWRPVVWSGAAFVVLAVVGNGLQPEVEPLPGLRPIHNPLVYLPAAKPLVDLSIGAAAAVCSLVGIGGAVTAPVVRFRRARGIERQQLKWRRSAFASATRSTWIRSRASCWPWSIRRWNRPGCRCGCDRRRRAPGTPPVDVYEVVAQWPAWGNGPDPRPGWSAKVWMRLSIRCRGRRRDRKGVACPIPVRSSRTR